MPCTIISSPARASRCRSSTVDIKRDELPNREGMRKRALLKCRTIYHFYHFRVGLFGFHRWLKSRVGRKVSDRPRESGNKHLVNERSRRR